MSLPLKTRCWITYDEGLYQGTFAISNVYAAGNSISGGRFIVETRATLESISLEDIQALPDEVPEKTIESDPIQEEPKHKDDAAEPYPAEVLDPESLFGHLWPLEDSVKLDPTIDRADFRRQRDYLKSQGYTFNPVGQTWTKQA